MILQALTAYYEALVKKGKAPVPGWSKVKVSYAIELDDSGAVIGVQSLKYERSDGKKSVWLPLELTLPAPIIRTVGILPNFLCDNAKYMIGYSADGDSRALKCFESSAELHRKLLSGIELPAVKALIGFFSSYKPENLPDCILDIKDDLSGANLVFMYDGRYIHDIPEVKDVWQEYYDRVDNGNKMICLVTGEPAVPMETHPAIKGVRNAQTAGAAIVSFNAPAYESFNREQNLNAPVGKYASFAYTTALNYLTKNRFSNRIAGDSTVVYWAEDGEESYQDFYTELIDGKSEKMSDKDLSEAIHKCRPPHGGRGLKYRR